MPTNLHHDVFRLLFDDCLVHKGIALQIPTFLEATPASDYTAAKRNTASVHTPWAIWLGGPYPVHKRPHHLRANGVCLRHGRACRVWQGRAAGQGRAVTSTLCASMFKLFLHVDQTAQVTNQFPVQNPKSCI